MTASSYLFLPLLFSSTFFSAAIPSMVGADGMDASFSASGSLNFSWLGAALGDGPSTTPASPTTPPPPTPPPSTAPPPLTIPQQYAGSPCICKMMAEIAAKMNLLLDGQIAAINGSVADPSVTAYNNAALVFASPVSVDKMTIVVQNVQADPTVLEQLSAKIKMYIPAGLKQILISIRISELQSLLAMLKDGSIKTLKDLIKAIQEKMPALYALLKALYLKLYIKIDDLKAMLGEKALNFLKEIGKLLVDDAKEIYTFVSDSLKSNPSLGPNMLSAFLGLFGNLTLNVNGKSIQSTVAAAGALDPACVAGAAPSAVPVLSATTQPPPPSSTPMNCQKPQKTAMLIYNKSDPKIKTQVKPAAECQCDATNSIVFFNPVDKTPTTGVNAGASPINQQCSKIEDFCICDESDVCWKLTNAKAEVVINSFCDPDCHMYARLNNIAPYTQTLQTLDGSKQIKLSDELMTISADGKRHKYKDMKSSADYYVKAKSISCTGAGTTCAPIKCAPSPVSSSPPPPPQPPANCTMNVSTAVNTIDVQISITIDASLMAMLQMLGITQLPPNMGITVDPNVQMALPPALQLPSSTPAPPPSTTLISSDPSSLIAGGGSSSIFVSIQLIMQDISNQIKANSDDPMAVLKGQVDINVDVDANLNALGKKCQALMPETPLELLSKVKPSDVQGLQAIVDIVIQGQLDLSKPDDLCMQVKQKAPGINDSVLGLLATMQNYLKQFGDPATQKLGQQIYQLNASLRVSIKAQCDANQAGMQKIKDLLLQYYPSAGCVLDGKVNPLGALIKLLTNGMKELSDKVKYQQALDGMKMDPNNLSDLALAIKGMLSVDIRATLAMIQPKDIDGIQVVLNMSASGQIECIADMIKAMTTNCPGLMQALLMLIRKLIILLNTIYQKLDDASKDLIKKILQAIIDFFKNDVKKAVQLLQQNAPGMLQKMLDDLLNAVPSLKPLINGLKFSLNVDISVKVDGNGIVANAQVNGSVQQQKPTSSTAASPTCPASGGTWSAWTNSGQCTKPCGLCGTQTQQRTCTTAASGCPCSGPTTQDIKCNPQPCVFPQQSCCSGQAAKQNPQTKQIECMP